MHNYRYVDDYIIATTSKGEEFLISREDEGLLHFRTFSTQPNFNGSLYLKCKLNNKRVFLHNLILKPPTGYVVDHINEIL